MEEVVAGFHIKAAYGLSTQCCQPLKNSDMLLQTVHLNPVGYAFMWPQKIGSSMDRIEGISTVRLC